MRPTKSGSVNFAELPPIPSGLAGVLRILGSDPLRVDRARPHRKSMDTASRIVKVSVRPTVAGVSESGLDSQKVSASINTGSIAI